MYLGLISRQHFENEQSGTLERAYDASLLSVKFSVYVVRQAGAVNS
jgi:hypothetical protein